MEKSLADTLERRAAAVGGIGSDDAGAALDKLLEKVAALEAQQAFMAAANDVIRDAVKAGLRDIESEGRSLQARALPGLRSRGQPPPLAPAGAGDGASFRKLSYTVEEAAAATGIGRTKLYLYMKSGQLRRHKAGKRTLLLADDLQALLATLWVPEEDAV